MYESSGSASRLADLASFTQASVNSSSSTLTGNLRANEIRRKISLVRSVTVIALPWVLAFVRGLAFVDPAIGTSPDFNHYSRYQWNSSTAHEKNTTK
jgi:hypothetical protein